MTSEGIAPDQYTASAVMAACARTGQAGVICFSPTAPISPICRTPLFPYLTFESCQAGVARRLLEEISGEGQRSGVLDTHSGGGTGGEVTGESGGGPLEGRPVEGRPVDAIATIGTTLSSSSRAGKGALPQWHERVYATAMLASAEGGEPLAATLALLPAMRARALKPSAHAYTIALKACAMRGGIYVIYIYIYIYIYI